MLETIWESRWLPDTLKNNSGWKTTKGFIIEIRVTKENWYLPVIRGRKGFRFLMTDKTVKGALQSESKALR